MKILGKTPKFWYQPRLSPQAVLLWPLSLLWRLGTAIKKRPNYTAPNISPDIPIVAVGNLTAGGTGKTPLVAQLAAKATAHGRRPVILTRGYGGTQKTPHLVQKNDSPKRIGDEACLLRHHAPVVIAHNRGLGAAFIKATLPKCDLILMDDGLQNTTIKPHLKIGVFNAKLSIGNGHIIPAGPLREPLKQGLNNLDAAIITQNNNLDDNPANNPDNTPAAQMLKKNNFNKPIFTSTRRLNPQDLQKAKTAPHSAPAFAFAAIAHPQKFYAMLKAEGINLIGQKSFADHHPFTTTDINALYKHAQAAQAILITTEKDYMRLPQDAQNRTLAIRLETSVSRTLLDFVLAKGIKKP